MASKIDRFVTVWDNAGIERRVRGVDAREIIEAGGSGELPQTAKTKTVADIGVTVDESGNEVTENVVGKVATKTKK